jgi:hypothetical protein
MFAELTKQLARREANKYAAELERGEANKSAAARNLKGLVSAGTILLVMVTLIYQYPRGYSPL